jgi:hypothetical protein
MHITCIVPHTQYLKFGLRSTMYYVVVRTTLERKEERTRQICCCCALLAHVCADEGGCGPRNSAADRSWQKGARHAYQIHHHHWAIVIPLYLLSYKPRKNKDDSWLSWLLAASHQHITSQHRSSIRPASIIPAPALAFKSSLALRFNFQHLLLSHSLLAARCSNIPYSTYFLVDESKERRAVSLCG